MFAFAFNQGYICGIFGSNYLGYNLEDVDKTKPLEWENHVIEFVKKSNYYKKILSIFTEEEIIDFEEGLRLGTFNGIAFKFNKMNMFFLESKQYDKIIHEDIKNPYYGVYGINKIGKNILYKGKEIGKVNFIKSWNSQDYWTYLPIESYCDRCGYEKFCKCYGFSSLNSGMIGSHDYHLGHNLCIICGECYKANKSFMCKNCFDEHIHDKLIEEKNKYENRNRNDFRMIMYHVRDYKRTFFKDKNLKCLNCDEEVDPINGLISCSKKCTTILLGYYKI